MNEIHRWALGSWWIFCNYMQNYVHVCMLGLWGVGGGKRAYNLPPDYQGKWFKWIIIAKWKWKGNNDYWSFWESIICKHLRESWHHTRQDKKQLPNDLPLSDFFYKKVESKKTIFICWFWNKYLIQKCFMQNLALMSWKDQKITIIT